MSRVTNVTALIERISGTPEHPPDGLTSRRRRPLSVTNWRLRNDPKDRVLRRDANQIGFRCVRAHAREELTDFPRPLREIGAEDRWLLPVGYLLDLHGFGVPAEG